MLRRPAEFTIAINSSEGLSNASFVLRRFCSQLQVPTNQDPSRMPPKVSKKAAKKAGKSATKDAVKGDKKKRKPRRKESYGIYIREVKDCTISRLLSMAMNMLFMMVRHAQKVKGEA